MVETARKVEFLGIRIKLPAGAVNELERGSVTPSTEYLIVVPESPLISTTRVSAIVPAGGKRVGTGTSVIVAVAEFAGATAVV